MKDEKIDNGKTTISLPLSPQHLADLRRSGLSDETIQVLGFYSGNPTNVKKILGFGTGPGLVIPYPCVGETRSFSRVKPDNPIINNHPVKYLSPRGATVRAFIPPKTWQALKDPRNPVIISEGEKKSAKADQEGFPCIGLGGIWGFSQNHQLIPDLANIKWEVRTEQISILATRFTLLMLAALAIKGYGTRVYG